MREIVFIAASFFLTVIGVGLFRRWSVARGILDVPNERSSHDSPTPRGGGVVIVLVVLAVFALYGLLSGNTTGWPFIAASIVLAIVSWLDDLYSIPFYLRLFVHLAVAVVFVFSVGSFGSIAIPGFSNPIVFGGYGPLLTVGWIVWMINAYNFMDGIDGIAGIQGVVAGIAWAVFGIITPSTALVVFGGTLAAVCLGFLVFNWSPAKIFMGDVGSSFLGFAFAVLPLLAITDANIAIKGQFAYAAMAFVWLFFADTVITLIRRIFERKRFWNAHREHLYQRMVIAGMSHARVSTIYGLAAGLIAGFALLQHLYSDIFGYFSLLSLSAAPLAIIIWARYAK
jgi:UDP-N-acetylmuramyl pentapeptide phosphotransferase/UDP-N-acetylglucosamine-1-phosphate transferase